MEGCRPATPEDVDDLVVMERALRREVLDVRGGAIWALREARPEPLDGAFRALIDSPDARVLVGTLDGVALGFAVGELTGLHDEQRLGLISGLYVDPEARGVGLGEALIDDLLDFFREARCVGVDAWALPGHRMTKNFFEQQGLVSRLIVVHKALGPVEPDADGDA